MKKALSPQWSVCFATAVSHFIWSGLYLCDFEQVGELLWACFWLWVGCCGETRPEPVCLTSWGCWVDPGQQGRMYFCAVLTGLHMLLIFLSFVSCDFPEILVWDFKLASKFKDYYLASKSSFPPFPNCCLNAHPFLFQNWMIMRGSDGLTLRILNKIRLWSHMVVAYPRNHSESSLALRNSEKLVLGSNTLLYPKTWRACLFSLRPLVICLSIGISVAPQSPEWTWISGLTILENLSVVCNFLPLGVAEFAGPNLLDLFGFRKPTPTQGADHQVNLCSTGAAERSPSPQPKPWQLAIRA